MLNERRAGAEEPLQLTADGSAAGSMTDKLARLEAVLRAQSDAWTTPASPMSAT